MVVAGPLGVECEKDTQADQVAKESKVDSKEKVVLKVLPRESGLEVLQLKTSCGAPQPVELSEWEQPLQKPTPSSEPDGVLISSC